MSTSFCLQVPRAAWEQISRQARAELPNECCGLLAGTVEDTAAGRVGRVGRVFPLTNTLSSPTEFLSDAAEMFRAVREMRETGIYVLAVYHSHPTSDPVPSRKDQDMSYGEGVVTLILSPHEPLRSKAWWLTPAGVQPAEWSIQD